MSGVLTSYRKLRFTSLLPRSFSSNRKAFNEIVIEPNILHYLDTRNIGILSNRQHRIAVAQKLRILGISNESYKKQENIPYPFRSTGTKLAVCSNPYKLPNFFKTPEVALIGRANVGKSTLINTLLGFDSSFEQKARMEDKPGVTRDLQFFGIGRRPLPSITSNLNDSFSNSSSGPALILVDMPGYGFSFMSEEQQHRCLALSRAYLSDKNRPLKRVLLILDARHGFKIGDKGFFSKLFSRSEMIDEREDVLFSSSSSSSSSSPTSSSKPPTGSAKKTSELPWKLQIVLTKCDLVDRMDLARRIQIVRDEIDEMIPGYVSSLPIMVLSGLHQRGVVELQRELSALVPPPPIRSTPSTHTPGSTTTTTPSTPPTPPTPATSTPTPSSSSVSKDLLSNKKLDQKKSLTNTKPSPKIPLTTTATSASSSASSSSTSSSTSPSKKKNTLDQKPSNLQQTNSQNKQQQQQQQQQPQKFKKFDPKQQIQEEKEQVKGQRKGKENEKRSEVGKKQLNKEILGLQKQNINDDDEEIEIGEEEELYSRTEESLMKGKLGKGKQKQHNQKQQPLLEEDDGGQENDDDYVDEDDDEDEDLSFETDLKTNNKNKNKTNNKINKTNKMNNIINNNHSNDDNDDDNDDDDELIKKIRADKELKQKKHEKQSSKRIEQMVFLGRGKDRTPITKSQLKSIRKQRNSSDSTSSVDDAANKKSKEKMSSSSASSKSSISINHKVRKEETRVIVGVGVEFDEDYKAISQEYQNKNTIDMPSSPSPSPYSSPMILNSSHSSSSPSSSSSSSTSSLKPRIIHLNYDDLAEYDDDEDEEEDADEKTFKGKKNPSPHNQVKNNNRNQTTPLQSKAPSASSPQASTPTPQTPSSSSSSSISTRGRMRTQLSRRSTTPSSPSSSPSSSSIPSIQSSPSPVPSSAPSLSFSSTESLSPLSPLSSLSSLSDDEFFQHQLHLAKLNTHNLTGEAAYKLKQKNNHHNQIYERSVIEENDNDNSVMLSNQDKHRQRRQQNHSTSSSSSSIASSSASFSFTNPPRASWRKYLSKHQQQTQNEVDEIEEGKEERRRKNVGEEIDGGESLSWLDKMLLRKQKRAAKKQLREGSQQQIPPSTS